MACTTLLRMAMGRRTRDRQPPMWVATTELPTAASHPFYARLNQLLREHGFDDFAEKACAEFYAATRWGGRAWRLASTSACCWWVTSKASMRSVPSRGVPRTRSRSETSSGCTLPEAPPDHSTISRTRRLIDLETHRAVFTWVLARLGEAGLVKGQTVAIDATTLEANAALRSIVRRDTGESYHDFLTQLATTSGIATPTRADLARLDRRRKKKGSNDDWTSPADPDAKITKMRRRPDALGAQSGARGRSRHARDRRGHGAGRGRGRHAGTLPETLAEAIDQLDRVTDEDG